MKQYVGTVSHPTADSGFWWPESTANSVGILAMPLGISRGYEPGRILLQLPVTHIGDGNGYETAPETGMILRIRMGGNPAKSSSSLWKKYVWKRTISIHLTWHQRGV